jgi:hypothetical protein
MINISDVEGRLVTFLGSTGNAGTSINLNTVAVTTVVQPGTWQKWMPLFLFLTRFSTGSGLVPTATVTAGTSTPTVPVDFKASGALSGSGPTQVFPALSTISFYTAANSFFFAVTAGAVGTCDAVLYGVLEGG